MYVTVFHLHRDMALTALIVIIGDRDLVYIILYVCDDDGIIIRQRQKEESE